MDWARMLAAAENHFLISGVTLYGWSRSPLFAKALSAKCAAGCQVRIILLHPENPAIGDYLAGATSSLEQLSGEVRLACDALRRAADGSANLEIRLLSTRAPHLQMAINETEAVAIPYLLSRPKKEGPLMLAKAESSLHGVLRGEFEMLWADSVP